jgi:hypothetical protein
MPLRLSQASRISGTLADMVLRLACQRCGGAPAVVTLRDRMDGQTAPYGNPPWRLVLVLVPVPVSAEDAAMPPSSPPPSGQPG